MIGFKSGTIQFREGQNSQTQIRDNTVTIFAPAWVEKALEKLLPEFHEAQFEMGCTGKFLTIDKLSLTELVAIARNERANVTGIINFNLYKNIKPEAIIALRDVVKHCVIVGKDVAINYGGYPASKAVTSLNKTVYVCDLPGLQFQQANNTGRHVLIPLNGSLPQGLLDDDIYENTVGEKKTSLQEAQANRERYIEGNFHGAAVLFDVNAFQAFVMQDFVLAAKALNIQAKMSNEELNFKFLKYGTGFFADGLTGTAKNKLSLNLAKGILKGLTHLMSLPLEERSQIKRIELPFYQEHNNDELTNALNSIRGLCQRNSIEFATTTDDALKQTSERYITATTNCSDPHAPTGNEMHYGSVDAAIAENLRLKGNNFSPICNPDMGQSYLALNLPRIEENNSNLSPQIPRTSRKISVLSAITVSVFASALIAGAAFSLGIVGTMAGVITQSLITFPLFFMMSMKYNEQSHQYYHYKDKTEQQLDQLNNTQLTSFTLGVNAAKTRKDQLYACVAWQGYRSPKAYYAGVEAQNRHDEALIAKVRQRIR